MFWEDREGPAIRGHEVACVITYEDLNSITIPSAIIRSRTFDLSSDETAVASAGVVIAHEMSHGAFDTEGFNYSPDGVWKKWWPEEDLENYRRMRDREGTIYVVHIS